MACTLTIRLPGHSVFHLSVVFLHGLLVVSLWSFCISLHVFRAVSDFPNRNINARPLIQRLMSLFTNPFMTIMLLSLDHYLCLNTASTGVWHCYMSLITEAASCLNKPTRLQQHMSKLDKFSLLKETWEQFLLLKSVGVPAHLQFSFTKPNAL